MGLTFNTGLLSDAIKVSSTLNVGIGTSSPSELLHLYGTNPYFLLQGSEASAKTLYIRESAGGMYFGEYGVATRMMISSSGNVGIGTNTPIGKFSIKLETATAVSTIAANGWDSTYAIIGNPDVTTGTSFGIGTNNSVAGINLLAIAPASDWVDFNYYSRNHIFYGVGTERMRISSNGNVGINTNSSIDKLQIHSAGSTTNEVALRLRNPSGAFAPATVGIYFQGGYTSYYEGAAAIMGGRQTAANDSFLTFWTNPGGTTLNERMRITSNGHVWIGQTSTSDPVSSNIAGIAFEGSLGSGKFSRSGNAALDVNRVTNDGELQRFYQDGIQEGSISVSGATVSYNSFLGSHWSQLQDGSRTEILKGTILEAIDELCVWENEINERLPKSKISDTIESKNVYGTFFDWDNDWQGSNDFYVSSVGLGFIRVNGNEIIEIGDLLQSNGDGTAKVQSDDIMRSSTIAKVVSTNKIETYEDGSYLIAATLHCG